MQVLRALMAVVGLEFLVSLGEDRHLFRAPLTLVEEHPLFQKLRGQAVEKIDLLQESMRRTGGPLYQITTYAELDSEGKVHVYVVDGAQRLRAEIQNGAETTFIQVVTRWKSLDEAFKEAIDANFARYEVSDNDLIAILQTGRVGTAELASRTGHSETKVRDFAKIANHEWACELIRKQAVGRTNLGKLIDACGNNARKLQALGNALSGKLAKAVADAEEVATRIKTDKKRNYGSKYKQRAEVSFYFRDVNWAAWEEALKEDTVPTEIKDGKPHLKVEGVARGRAAAPGVGNDIDWDREVAIYDFAGHKLDEILTEDFEAMRDRLPEIQRRLEVIIRRRHEAEAKEKHPMPPIDPDVVPPSDPAPVAQTPEAKVGRRSTVD